MIAILTLVASLSAFAADQEPKDLFDHYQSEVKLAKARGKTRIENENRGYLVKIEGQHLVAETPEYALYSSQVMFGTKHMPVALLMDSAFKEQFQQMKVAEKRKFDGLRKLSSEGGGNFREDPPYEMFVLAVPKEGHKVVLPNDGTTLDALAFQVIQVCKDSYFKKCTPIQKEPTTGVFGKLFGG